MASFFGQLVISLFQKRFNFNRFLRIQKTITAIKTSNANTSKEPIKNPYTVPRDENTLWVPNKPSIIISRTKIEINQYYSIGWQMFISAIVMGLFTYLSGNYIAITEIPAISWGVIIYMVIGGSIFAFVSFIYSMKNLHPAIASLYAYINPIVAIWVGSLLIKGEQITWNSILGTICTLTGVYLVNRSLKKQKDPVEAVADADGM